MGVIKFLKYENFFNELSETPYSQSNNNSKEDITPLNFDYRQEKEGGFSIIKKKNQLGQLKLSHDNNNKGKKTF